MLADGAGKISSVDKASARVMSLEVAFTIIHGFIEKEKKKIMALTQRVLCRYGVHLGDDLNTILTD